MQSENHHSTKEPSMHVIPGEKLVRLRSAGHVYAHTSLVVSVCDNAIKQTPYTLATYLTHIVE